MEHARLRLLAELQVSLVLDVGANTGQYATRLREAGYRGPIISFEPISAAYSLLREGAAGDPKWETRMLALADSPGRATLNISANSYSSSLPISDLCLDAAPEAAYVQTQTVDVATLDSLDFPEGPILLKLDVQGYEPRVLRGADRLLSRIAVIELELSLVPLYAGQELAPEVCALLRRRGFIPIAFDTAFSHPGTSTRSSSSTRSGS